MTYNWVFVYFFADSECANDCASVLLHFIVQILICLKMELKFQMLISHPNSLVFLWNSFQVLFNMIVTIGKIFIALPFKLWSPQHITPNECVAWILNQYVYRSCMVEVDFEQNEKITVLKLFPHLYRVVGSSISLWWQPECIFSTEIHSWIEIHIFRYENLWVKCNHFSCRN